MTGVQTCALPICRLLGDYKAVFDVVLDQGRADITGTDILFEALADIGLDDRAVRNMEFRHGSDRAGIELRGGDGLVGQQYRDTVIDPVNPSVISGDQCLFQYGNERAAIVLPDA